MTPLRLLSISFLALMAPWSPDASPSPDLAQAIATAQPGAEIRLPPGSFSGPIVIDKPIAIIGSGPDSTTIQGPHAGNVITITAPGVTLRRLAVRGSGTDLLYDDAGILVLSDHNTFEDLLLEDNLHGIYLKGSNHNTLRRIRVHGRRWLKEEDRGNGFHVWNAHNNIFEDNEIGWSRDAIYFSFASDDVLRRNYAHHSRYGIHFMYADRETVDNNLLEDNVVGLVVMFSKDIRALSNTIRRNNAGFRSYGLLMSEAYRLRAEGNAIVANNTGILMDLSLDNIFSGNLIAGNFLGINLLASSQNNLFVGNTFFDNGADVRIGQEGLGNRWTDTAGNYWASYRGWDLDGDGVGDVPHKASDLFSFLTEERPQLLLLLGSPAMSLLNEAERRFPVLPVPKVVDTRPLMRPSVAIMPPQEARPPTPPWLIPSLMATASGILTVWIARHRFGPRKTHA